MSEEQDRGVAAPSSTWWSTVRRWWLTGIPIFVYGCAPPYLFMPGLLPATHLAWSERRSRERRRRSMNDEGQLIMATIERDELVLDCCVTPPGGERAPLELRTLRVRLPRRSRALETAVRSWSTSPTWIGVTVVHDARGGRVRIESDATGTVLQFDLIC